MIKCYEQEVPTIEEANLLLKEAEILFPGQWVQHSIFTAKAAKIIAENCKELDSEVAYVLGCKKLFRGKNGEINIQYTTRCY